MRTFVVQRTEDISGVSGTGIIAQGVEFDDGQVAVCWLSKYHIVEVAACIKTWIGVHGHGGSTTVIWDQGLEECVNNRPTTTTSSPRPKRASSRKAKK